MNSDSASGDQILFPVTISVKANTAKLLSEIAQDMGISLDDVLSVLAEDAAIDLERRGDRNHKKESSSKTFIPEKCSREDLWKELERRLEY
tara:strand:+ start:463 stop:735 length:273 start_codon:yes stop_codon:yes gene_type:complete